jgi:hypothetical protein
MDAVCQIVFGLLFASCKEVGPRYAGIHFRLVTVFLYHALGHGVGIERILAQNHAEGFLHSLVVDLRRGRHGEREEYSQQKKGEQSLKPAFPSLTGVWLDHGYYVMKLHLV